MSQRSEIKEYIQEIKDDLLHVRDHSDCEDYINFKLDTLLDMMLS